MNLENLHELIQRYENSIDWIMYQADIYANIRRNDIYKVGYTVGPPEEIDRINNTCCFTSKSSGKNMQHLWNAVHVPRFVRNMLVSICWRWPCLLAILIVPL